MSNTYHEKKLLSEVTSHNKLCYQLENIFCNLKAHYSAFLFNGRSDKGGSGRLSAEGVCLCLCMCSSHVLYRITCLLRISKSLTYGQALKNKLFCLIQHTAKKFSEVFTTIGKSFYGCLYLIQVQELCHFLPKYTNILSVILRVESVCNYQDFNYQKHENSYFFPSEKYVIFFPLFPLHM